ncbi:MAG: hypothetical protein ACREF1_09715 [Acetobacteraceae bacterium]
MRSETPVRREGRRAWARSGDLAPVGAAAECVRGEGAGGGDEGAHGRQALLGHHWRRGFHPSERSVPGQWEAGRRPARRPGEFGPSRRCRCVLGTLAR